MPDLFQHCRPLVLDGGFATELERRGFDLKHPLWSARLLDEAPDAIRKLHVDWIEAGADIITTSSYQASLRGMQAVGFSPSQAEALLRRSVSLAKEAVAESGEESSLVAAGVGPFGASLADGSEYRGNYGVTKSQLSDFHTPRWEILSQEQPDLLLCETIPDRLELDVLLELNETATIPVAVSFSCKDGGHISDGTPIRDAAGACAAAGVAAVGINCTAPRFVRPLIAELQNAAPTIPIIVYPNSGETYDAARKVWTGEADCENFAAMAADWVQQGAAIVGGCCRTTVEHIAAVSRVVRS